jgi:hypothetical protein
MMRIRRGPVSSLVALAVLLGGPAFVAADEITQVTVRVVDDVPEPYTVIKVDMGPSISEAMAAALDPAAQIELARRAMALDGDNTGTVTMWLPLVDYGSNGSYGSVRIASGEGVSFDPHHFVETKQERYTGTVTITEFTEDALAGTYSGMLYKGERVAGPPYVKAVSVGEVSGWFRMGAPIASDDRIKGVPSADEDARAAASALWDGVRVSGIGLRNIDRLGDIAGFSAEFERQLRGDAPGGGAGAAGGGAVLSSPGCDCRCAVIMSVPEDHHCLLPTSRCAPISPLCRPGVASAAPAAGGGATDDIDAILDLIAAQGAPPEAQEALRETLQTLSPAERRQMLEMYRQATGQR